MALRFAALCFAAIVTGCATVTASDVRCASGQQQAVNDLLYFGTSKPNGSVSSGEWSDFLSSVVTPRFPKGFTAWRARGQWKSDSGEIQREGSYVMSIVHPAGDAADVDILAVIAEYKTRFKQESVLRVSSVSCISF